MLFFLNIKLIICNHNQDWDIDSHKRQGLVNGTVVCKVKNKLAHDKLVYTKEDSIKESHKTSLPDYYTSTIKNILLLSILNNDGKILHRELKNDDSKDKPIEEINTIQKIAANNIGFVISKGILFTHEHVNEEQVRIGHFGIGNKDDKIPNGNNKNQRDELIDWPLNLTQTSNHLIKKRFTNNGPSKYGNQQNFQKQYKEKYGRNLPIDYEITKTIQYPHEELGQRNEKKYASHKKTVTKKWGCTPKPRYLNKTPFQKRVIQSNNKNQHKPTYTKSYGTKLPKKGTTKRPMKTKTIYNENKYGKNKGVHKDIHQEKNNVNNGMPWEEFQNSPNFMNNLAKDDQTQVLLDNNIFSPAAQNVKTHSMNLQPAFNTNNQGSNNDLALGLNPSNNSFVKQSLIDTVINVLLNRYKKENLKEDNSKQIVFKLQEAKQDNVSNNPTLFKLDFNKYLPDTPKQQHQNIALKNNKVKDRIRKTTKSGNDIKKSYQKKSSNSFKIQPKGNLYEEAKTILKFIPFNKIQELLQDYKNNNKNPNVSDFISHLKTKYGYDNHPSANEVQNNVIGNIKVLPINQQINPYPNWGNTFSNIYNYPMVDNVNKFNVINYPLNYGMADNLDYMRNYPNNNYGTSVIHPLKHSETRDNKHEISHLENEYTKKEPTEKAFERTETPSSDLSCECNRSCTDSVKSKLWHNKDKQASLGSMYRCKWKKWVKNNIKSLKQTVLNVFKHKNKVTRSAEETDTRSKNLRQKFTYLPLPLSDKAMTIDPRIPNDTNDF